MFRPSHPLQKFINIHHPMPLTARESKQLLNLLTTSFRKNLDTAHGVHGPKLDPHVPNIPTRLHTAFKWKSSLDSSFRPTDHHMHSILTNPLFHVAPEAKSDMKDPMVVFEQAAAKGMLTLDAAANCLAQKRRLIIQSSVISVRDSMRESGAGKKVVAWLLSSGTANDNMFLRNDKFANNLMDFMVAEGLQERAWAWISRAVTLAPSSTHYSELSAMEKHDYYRPLLLLIKAEASRPNGLEAAIQCLARAAKHSSLRAQSPLNKRRFLGIAGSYLCAEVTNSNLAPQSISETAINTLIKLVPDFSKVPEYYIAHLALFHPSQPSADLAVQYLRAHAVLAPGKNISIELDQRRKRSIVSLGLATAKFLLEQEQLKEAAWVMDLLQTSCPELFKVPAKAKAREEESNIHLLDNLSLA